MPNEVNVERRAEDFLYPKPSLIQKLSLLFQRGKIQAEALAYTEGIDESKYQYSATKRVDHAAALAGGVTFTVIRVSNCVTADPYFDQAWQDAQAAGMPVLVYANVQGYKGGAEQAKFAIATAAPFIAACKHKVVIIGDFEADGLTMTVAARQKLAMDFLNEIHLKYETGIYSNIKYWGEMYGNLKPPAWAWLFGAHWTSAAVGSFPSSWDLSKMIMWQYGVWDNYSWALPVPGNAPDIDKDRWVWAGGDVAAFLKVDTLPPVEPPVPPEEHTHAELEERITALEEKFSTLQSTLVVLGVAVTDINERVKALVANPGNMPFVWFVPTGGSAVIQHASKWYRTSGGLDKPIFVPVGSGTHPKVNGKARVFPLPVTGDGGQVCYMLLDQVIDGETVYVRRQDGAIQEGG